MPHASCLGVYAAERLPATRWSTKADLYRDLLLGRQFLMDNFADRVTVADAAEAAHMSEFHFVRLFKALFGCTPGKFLREIRVSEARSLISTTHLSLEEIAWSIGLSEPASLSRLFRKQLQVRPSSFRPERKQAMGQKT